MKSIIKHLKKAKQRKVFVITGKSTHPIEQTLFKEGFQEKPDAENFLIEMGCEKKGSFWQKEHMIFSINEVRIHSKLI